MDIVGKLPDILGFLPLLLGIILFFLNNGRKSAVLSLPLAWCSFCYFVLSRHLGLAVWTSLFISLLLTAGLLFFFLPAKKGNDIKSGTCLTVSDSLKSIMRVIKKARDSNKIQVDCIASFCNIIASPQKGTVKYTRDMFKAVGTNPDKAGPEPVYSEIEIMASKVLFPVIIDAITQDSSFKELESAPGKFILGKLVSMGCFRGMEGDTVRDVQEGKQYKFYAQDFLNYLANTCIRVQIDESLPDVYKTKEIINKILGQMTGEEILPVIKTVVDGALVVAGIKADIDIIMPGTVNNSVTDSHTIGSVENKDSTDGRNDINNGSLAAGSVLPELKESFSDSGIVLQEPDGSNIFGPGNLRPKEEAGSVHKDKDVGKAMEACATLKGVVSGDNNNDYFLGCIEVLETNPDDAIAFSQLCKYLVNPDKAMKNERFDHWEYIAEDVVSVLAGNILTLNGDIKQEFYKDPFLVILFFLIKNNVIFTDDGKVLQKWFMPGQSYFLYEDRLLQCLGEISKKSITGNAGAKFAAVSSYGKHELKSGLDILTESLLAGVRTGNRDEMDSIRIVVKISQEGI